MLLNVIPKIGDWWQMGVLDHLIWKKCEAFITCIVNGFMILK